MENPLNSKTLLINDYLHVLQTRHGYLMCNINDYIGAYLKFYGEWAEPELSLLDQFIAYGDTILDIGANIGTHTLFFSKSVHISGKVYAFEPQRLIYQILCGNAALNCLLNVFPMQLAIGEKADSILVPVIDPHEFFNFGNLSLGEQEHGESVSVIIIDSLALPKCNLIKIDVEGGELGVLKGAEKTIKTFQPVIYIENNNHRKSTELLQWFKQAGYQCWWHVYHRFNPNNFMKQKENILIESSFESNMLCLPLSMDIADINLDGLELIQDEQDNHLKFLKRHYKIQAYQP